MPAACGKSLSASACAFGPMKPFELRSRMQQMRTPVSPSQPVATMTSRRGRAGGEPDQTARHQPVRTDPPHQPTIDLAGDHQTDRVERERQAELLRAEPVHVLERERRAGDVGEQRAEAEPAGQRVDEEAAVACRLRASTAAIVSTPPACRASGGSVSGRTNTARSPAGSRPERRRRRRPAATSRSAAARPRAAAPGSGRDR